MQRTGLAEPGSEPLPTLYTYGLAKPGSDSGEWWNGPMAGQ